MYILCSQIKLTKVQWGQVKLSKVQKYDTAKYNRRMFGMMPFISSKVQQYSLVQFMLVELYLKANAFQKIKSKIQFLVQLRHMLDAG